MVSKFVNLKLLLHFLTNLILKVKVSFKVYIQNKFLSSLYPYNKVTGCLTVCVPKDLANG